MVKLDDVAKLAGVSKGTASRVLNNRGYISQQTRERIEAAVKELNYYPNENARNLLKRRSGMIGVVYAAILSAIAGYFFRMTQLSGGSSVPLIAFSILMVFVFALAAVSLEKKSAYEAVYRPSGQDLTFSLLGALGLIAGCVLSFRGSIAQMLVSLLGLLAGLSLGAGAVLRWKEKKPSAAFSVFVVLFYVAKLFRDFRHWEINPAILDYCFSLFAMIAFMLASYHAGAFSFERGARRRLAFYSLLGVLFGAISLAGAQLPELLIYAGSVFWMLACAQQMLRRSV